MKQSAALLLALLLLLSAALFLTACGSTEVPDIDASAATVMNSLKNALPDPAGMVRVPSGFICESAFGEDYQKLLDACVDWEIDISDKQDSNINEVGVFRVENASDVKAVEKILKEYLKAQKLRLGDLLDSYNPAEKPKLDNAVVTVKGNYVIYSILSADDTKSVKSAFDALFTAN